MSDRVELSILQSANELVELKADWDRLASAQRRDGMFRGYPWNVLWLKHIDPRAIPHVLKMRSGSGEVVGIVPFCRQTYKSYLFRLKSLGFTGREVTCGDFLDVLAAPGYEDQVLSCMLDYLEHALAQYDLVVIGECLRGSHTATRLDEWVRRNRLQARWQEDRLAPYIELPSSFDEYRRSLSRNTRTNLRRRKRQLLTEHGCTLKRLRGPSEVLPQLQHLFRLHGARWRSVGQEGVFSHPGFRDLLRAFISEAYPQTQTDLYLICAKDNPVAAILFFRWGKTTIYYQGGWDPASPEARLSPSLVLFGQAIADAIADGARHFEFLRGDETFKAKFTTTARRTATLLVSSGGMKPRSYLLGLQLKDRGKALRNRILRMRGESEKPVFSSSQGIGEPTGT
jgi:CelD/BcsL family acetyltransferase involved in cellulose biosynthesis